MPQLIVNEMSPVIEASIALAQPSGVVGEVDMVVTLWNHGRETASLIFTAIPPDGLTLSSTLGASGSARFDWNFDSERADAGYRCRVWGLQPGHRAKIEFGLKAADAKGQR